MKLRCALILAVLLLGGRVGAVDLNQLMPDIQRTSMRGHLLDIVLWMPTEFWQAALEQNPRVPPAAARQFVGSMSDISIFAIISGRVNDDGAVRFRRREEVLDTLQLKVGDQVLVPLPEEELSLEAGTLLHTMKPMISKMLGAVGEGMEFVVYRNVSDDGTIILNPMEPGEFHLELRGEKHRWRLPLGSLLPPRFDPQTGEKFPGNYRFSPFTGRELVEP